MTIRTILLTALCALPGAAILHAADVAVTPSPVTAPAAEYHPYFADMPYPAWSQLTAEQALIDAPAAIALANARLDAIRALSAGQMNFENTFVALAEKVKDNHCEIYSQCSPLQRSAGPTLQGNKTLPEPDLT